jgi:hypothetical protein
MEDWEVKKAYQLVYEDLWDICHMRYTCADCPIKEACNKCEESLYATIKTAMEKLYGKEEK